MAIVLDAMGSDHYPEPEVRAAVQAAEVLGEEVILVGKADLFSDLLERLNVNHAPVRIVDAPDVLEMTDKPVEAARKKPRNSMAVGMELVKTGQARAFVTAGNTGGAFFNAVQCLRRIQGISRPALTAIIPTRKGKAIFMDTGANADCRPEFLLEFAIMGSVYSEKFLSVASPRVSLLSNGEEEGKGNQLIKDATPLLKNSGLNFIGNVESKEIYAGEADVIVADGFSGNVFIKSSEAVAKFIFDIMRAEISASFLRKMGYLLLKPVFGKLKKLVDPAEVGAAILLGVNGLVFIGHGRSDERALFTALRNAKIAADAGLLEALQGAIQDRLT